MLSVETHREQAARVAEGEQHRNMGGDTISWEELWECTGGGGKIMREIPNSCKTAVVQLVRHVMIARKKTRRRGGPIMMALPALALSSAS